MENEKNDPTRGLGLFKNEKIGSDVVEKNIIVTKQQFLDIYMNVNIVLELH